MRFLSGVTGLTDPIATLDPKCVGAPTGSHGGRTLNLMNLTSVPTARFSGVSRGSSATTTRLSMAQLAQLSGVATAQLEGLMDYGVLAATRPEVGSATFDIAFVMTLQRAQRLRDDLALDDHGFALAVMLLQQVSDMEEEVRIVRSEAQRLLGEPHSTPRLVPLSTTHSER